MIGAKPLPLSSPIEAFTVAWVARIRAKWLESRAEVLPFSPLRGLTTRETLRIFLKLRPFLSWCSYPGQGPFKPFLAWVGPLERPPAGAAKVPDGRPTFREFVTWYGIRGK